LLIIIEKNESLAFNYVKTKKNTSYSFLSLVIFELAFFIILKNWAGLEYYLSSPFRCWNMNSGLAWDSCIFYENW